MTLPRVHRMVCTTSGLTGRIDITTDTTDATYFENICTERIRLEAIMTWFIPVEGLRQHGGPVHNVP